MSWIRYHQLQLSTTMCAYLAQNGILITKQIFVPWKIGI
jgi:hypothetical protein